MSENSGLLDGYLTKDQLASELGVSKRQLDRWEELRQGPPRIAIGRTILFKRTSVLDWLDSREVRHRRR